MPGFSFTDLYNMPVYLRNFYTTELIKQQAAETKELEKSKQSR